MIKQIANIRKTCEQCKVSFLAKRKTKRFCSKGCIRIRHYIPKIRKFIFKSCPYCKKDIRVTPSRAKLYITRFCNKDHEIKYRKEKSFNFNCIICNKTVFTQPCQIKFRNRKTCSRICNAVMVRQIAIKRRKDIGYTKHQLNRLARNSPESERWRKKVFERDNYTCQECNVRGTYLEAHHIKPFAYFPELRYEISNGQTMCRKCHNKTKVSAKKMEELYKIKKHL